VNKKTYHNIFNLLLIIESKSIFAAGSRGGYRSDYLLIKEE